jgi:hypothetical protein
LAGKLLSRPNARDTPLLHAMALFLQCTSAPERIDSLKDLVLEVPRLPLTYRSVLSPTSSPVARAAFLRPTTLMLEPAARFNFFRTATDDTNASR